MRGLLFLLALLVAHPMFALGAAVDVNNVTDTPQVILPTLPTRRVTWCVIEGGAAEEVVIFRAVGGTPEYNRTTVPAGTNLAVRLAQNVRQDGMEVVTADAAGDVSVLCNFKIVR